MGSVGIDRRGEPRHAGSAAAGIGGAVDSVACRTTNG